MSSDSESGVGEAPRVDVRMRVRPVDADRPLLDVLVERFPHKDREGWIDACRRGLISVDGAFGDPAQRLAQGQSVGYDLSEHVEPPTDTEYRIAYEDDRVLVIDKPGNLPCHRSGPYFRGNLMALLRERYGNRRLHLAGRLDRETSGAVLISFSAEDCKVLQARAPGSKRYLCVVQGRPRWQRLRCELPIAASPQGRYRRIAGVEGKDALTDFVRLAQGPRHALLLATPLTGRTHQIRVHASALGHPIAGDGPYGGREQPAPRRLLLHAGQLRFPHPAGHPAEVWCEPPEDFVEALVRRGLRLAPDWSRCDWPGVR